ncbi:S45A3 protein, partial [Polypterus senegalus]
MAVRIPSRSCQGKNILNMLQSNLQWHLVLLNFLTCGLEICVAAGITYVPPLLLEAGVEEQYMTMVLGIGPVLGLLLIPLIGSASDHCTSSYGRRRPFIWLLSLGVLLALFIIPRADTFASYFSWTGHTLHVAFLILGVGLLDFCGQVCFTPLEALLSDLYREEEDCGQAFAMFSFMVSLGGCIGYLLPAVNWSESYLAFYFGSQEECLFSLLTVIFVVSVLVTMKVSEECAYPSGHLLLEPKPSENVRPKSHYCCYPLGCKLRIFTSRPLICLLHTCWSMTPTIYRSYRHIPQVMRQLCMAQLCSWMAVMSFMLFYTDFIGEGLYEGVPSAAPGTELRIRYDEGIRMGSIGLFLQCATSIFFSIVMSKLVRYFGSKRIYLASMVSFTLSALVICLSKSIVLVTFMSALTGFAYATLQTLPYTLTCHYHKEKEVPDQLVLIAPPGGADKPSSVVAGSLQHPLAATPSPNRAAVVDSMSHGATGEIEEGSTARETAPKRPGEVVAHGILNKVNYLHCDCASVTALGHVAQFPEGDVAHWILIVADLSG